MEGRLREQEYAGYLMPSPGRAGSSSSWVIAHSARMKMTTASPLRLLARLYTFSMAARPAPMHSHPESGSAADVSLISVAACNLPLNAKI